MAMIEEGLRESKIKLDVILDSILTGVVLVDAQTHKIVEANTLAVQMIDAPKEEIIGKVCHQFVCLNKIGKCPITDFEQTADKSEYTLLKSSGKVIPILKTANIIMIADRKYIVERFLDISERKEIENLKSEFISTISHELRTPLSIIKEGISLVLDKIPGDINKEQFDILTTAKDNVNRLAKIINDLLDISKIEARKVELEKESIEVSSLIQEVVTVFKRSVEDKGLILKTEYPQEPIKVFLDVDKIIQVFANLVDNALKFTKQGYIKISIKNKESEVECAVSDTGIGISKDSLGKVFDKFQQIGRIPGPGIKGTGLGLSIAKEIVEMHGGRIWVESELEKGTKFIFTIPKLIL